MRRRRGRGSEDAFLRQVVGLAARTGWLTFHVRAARTSRGWRSPVSGSGKGFPDLVLVHPQRGRTLFVELKSRTGRLRAEQTVWLAALRIAGQDVRVWRPADWPQIEALLKGEGSAPERGGKLMSPLSRSGSDRGERFDHNAEMHPGEPVDG